MALFRCKMCGGDLEVSATDTICTCEYCGTEQTVPKLDTEKKANLYDRANHFRRNRYLSLFTPTNNSFFFLFLEHRSNTFSTSTSVSGCGISTFSST